MEQNSSATYVDPALEILSLKLQRKQAKKEVRRNLGFGKFLVLMAWVASCTYPVHGSWVSVFAPSALGLYYAGRCLWLLRKWRM